MTLSELKATWEVDLYVAVHRILRHASKVSGDNVRSQSFVRREIFFRACLISDKPAVAPSMAISIEPLKDKQLTNGLTVR